MPTFCRKIRITGDFLAIGNGRKTVVIEASKIETPLRGVLSNNVRGIVFDGHIGTVIGELPTSLYVCYMNRAGFRNLSPRQQFAVLSESLLIPNASAAGINR